MNLHYNFITDILDFFFLKPVGLKTRIEKQADGWLVIAEYEDGRVEKSLMPTKESASQTVGDHEFSNHRAALRAVWYRRPWSKKRKALLAEANKGFVPPNSDKEHSE